MVPATGLTAAGERVPGQVGQFVQGVRYRGLRLNARLDRVSMLNELTQDAGIVRCFGW
jgi:hypothetical protein